jgi:hypothetical protein
VHEAIGVRILNHERELNGAAGHSRPAQRR